MSFTLGDVARYVRLADPSFTQRLVPNVYLAERLSDYQRELVAEVMRWDPNYLVETMSILLALDEDGYPSDGSGGDENSNGVGVPLLGRHAVGYALGPAGDGAALFEAVHDGTDSDTTLSDASATFGSANALAGKIVYIKHDPNGTATGEWRYIFSSTGTSITVESYSPFSGELTDGTIFEIYAAAADESDRLVKAVPHTVEKDRYPIYVNTNGIAYIDWENPLQTRVEEGIPLPEYLRVLGGTIVRGESGIYGQTVMDPENTAIRPGRIHGPDFHIIDYAQRNRAPVFPSGYLQNGKLYLTGSNPDWVGISGIDLRYVPQPGSLTSLDTEFVVKDDARGVINAYAALCAAERIEAKGGEVNVARYEDRFARKVGAFFDAARTRGRPRSFTRRNR